MIKYLLFFSLLFFSCVTEEIEPENYSVQIKNNYFETIEFVTLGEYNFGTIEVNTASDETLVSKGVYSFSCITVSNLSIQTEIKIQGTLSNIIIQLDEKGKIELKP